TRQLQLFGRIPTFAKPNAGLLNLVPLSMATLKIALIALIGLLTTLGAYLPQNFVNQDRNSGSPSFRTSIVRASGQLFSMKPMIFLQHSREFGFRDGSTVIRLQCSHSASAKVILPQRAA